MEKFINKVYHNIKRTQALGKEIKTPILLKTKDKHHNWNTEQTIIKEITENLESPFIQTGFP